MASSHALAKRLRALREEHWPDLAITQSDLAIAFSVERSASVPLLSSWENLVTPKIPPLSRLAAYATFFATRRSVASKPYQLIPVTQLTAKETARREQLLQELIQLRTRALREVSAPDLSRDAADYWYFPDGGEITIVVSHLPESRLEGLPYADPAKPDYVELYNYSDLNALIELYGHIRAVNPQSKVNFRSVVTADPHDYSTHLVLLGGIDWNWITRDVLQRLNLPIRQLWRPDDQAWGGFEYTSSTDKSTMYQAKVIKHPDQKQGEILLQDAAQIYRGPNPFASQYSVTLFNGTFARGTLGGVRALIDKPFRYGNAEYIRSRFAGVESYCILTTVDIVNGQVITPDWTQPGQILFEWPEHSA